MKKLAVEFTNGVRQELKLAALSLLFITSDLTAKLFSAQPNRVQVSDTTQVLSSADLVRTIETTHAASVATIEDGLYIGQRLTVQVTKLLAASTLTLTSATDILASANSAALTNLVFDAEDQYAVLDWTPVGWQVVYATATQTAA